jgi:hypothetical protein
LEFEVCATGAERKPLANSAADRKLTGRFAGAAPVALVAEAPKPAALLLELAWPIGVSAPAGLGELLPGMYIPFPPASAVKILVLMDNNMFLKWEN